MKRAISDDGMALGGQLNAQQALQSFYRCVTGLDQLVAQMQQRMAVIMQKNQQGQQQLLPSHNAIVSDTNASTFYNMIAETVRATAAASRTEACHSFAQRVFNRMVERRAEPIAVHAYTHVLEVLREENCVGLTELITKWTLSLFTGTPGSGPPHSQSGTPRLLDVLVPSTLIKARLLQLTKYDQCLANQIPRNLSATATAPVPPRLLETVRFICSVVRAVVVQPISTSDSAVASTEWIQPCDFHITLNQLRDVARFHGQSTDRPILALLNDIHNASPRNASDSTRPTMPAVSKERDPTGIRQDIERLLVQWVNAVETNGGEQSYGMFLRELQSRGFLHGDDSIERLFRIMAELCVERFVQTGQYVGIDAFSKLVLLLVKYTNRGNPTTQVLLLSKVLIILARLLAWHSDESAKQTAAAVTRSLEDGKTSGKVSKNGDLNDRKGTANSKAGTSNEALSESSIASESNSGFSMVESLSIVSVAACAFDPRPFFRLFSNILDDFTAPESGFQGESSQVHVLTAIGNTLHAVQPSRVPQFAFAWAELLSHRSFMPLLLNCPNKSGWLLMQVLLSDYLSFMQPYLKNVELSDPVRTLYKGLLCILLVLLHDFPNFLCQYHVALCNQIPTTCIQLRNLVLSAFPRTMRLPDPFTRNLKVDKLPEISISPEILFNYKVSRFPLVR